MPDMPAPPMPTMCTRCSSSGSEFPFTAARFRLSRPLRGHLERHLGHPLRGVAMARHRRCGRHRRQARPVAEQPGHRVADELRA